MSTSDLLSQEEIEVLLDSVDDGGFASGTAIKEDLRQDGVKTYDFGGRERRLPRRHIGALERVNDRFAAALRSSLFQLLQCAPKIVVSGIQFQKFSDFMERLPTPANLNIVRMAPLRGRALIIMDSRLVFAAVDNFFGGNGQFDQHSQDREFTRTEMNIVRKVLGGVINDLKYAWEPVLAIDFDYLGSESNPNYAAIVGADDYVVTSTVNITLEGNGGELTVLLPYAMIESVSGLLDAPGDKSSQPDRKWQTALRHEVMGAKVSVNSFLTEITLSVNDLLRLKKGDVIPVEMPKTLSLRAEGVPVLTGKACISGGHCALQVIEKITGTDAV